MWHCDVQITGCKALQNSEHAYSGINAYEGSTWAKYCRRYVNSYRITQAVLFDRKSVHNIEIYGCKAISGRGLTGSVQKIKQGCHSIDRLWASSVCELLKLSRNRLATIKRLCNVKIFEL
jgi:hypothetical protein